MIALIAGVVAAVIVAIVAIVLRSRKADPNLPQDPKAIRETEQRTKEKVRAETDDVANWFVRSKTNGGGDLERCVEPFDPVWALTYRGKFERPAVRLALAKGRHMIPNPAMNPMGGPNNQVYRLKVVAGQAGGPATVTHRLGITSLDQLNRARGRDPWINDPDIFERFALTSDNPGEHYGSVRGFRSQTDLMADNRDTKVWYPFEDANPNIRYYTGKPGRTALVLSGGKVFALAPELWTPVVKGWNDPLQFIEPRIDWWPYAGSGLGAVGWIGAWLKAFLDLPVHIPMGLESIALPADDFRFKNAWAAPGGRWARYNALREAMVRDNSQW